MPRHHTAAALAALSLSAACLTAECQTAHNQAVDEYVRRFAPLAVRQMQMHGIPASITLAQGILESDSGRSRLATKGNNHFGIKCKSDWTGGTIYHDDDSPGECFRAYASAEDSYEDHSEFLTSRSRYSSLFTLDIMDYAAWAEGLKNAGYATNPQYAATLVRIIEENGLTRYDREAIDGIPGVKEKSRDLRTDELKRVPDTPPGDVQTASLPHGSVDRSSYVIVQSGDSFMSISGRTGISVKQLLKFNDLQYETPLTAGQTVYIKKKASSCGSVPTHTVDGKTTLYGISQFYGVKIKNLLKMNPGRDIYGTLPVGTVINLR